MKNADKITLTIGQLKRLINEASFYFYEQPKDQKEMEKRILDRVEEEYRNGNPGGALSLLRRYTEDHEPFYKYDFERWEKRCKAEFGAEP